MHKIVKVNKSAFIKGPTTISESTIDLKAAAKEKVGNYASEDLAWREHLTGCPVFSSWLFCSLLGSPEDQREWISILLSMASTKILLNAHPRRLIYHASSYHASLHANDMVIFVAPCLTNLLMLREIHNIFKVTAGLSMNLDKCVATPIHFLNNDTALL